MKKNKNAPIWAIQKTSLSDLNIKYTSDRDVTALPMADEVLTPFDINGTKAHVMMLSEIGVLTKKESQKIIKSLNNALKLYKKGKFKLDPALEDVHMNLKAFVSSSKECDSELGGRMHTGRSRNDQTATATRLYLRDACLQIQFNLIELIETLLKQALIYKDQVMAGITHHQNAVPSSLGHFYQSYAQALLRDAKRFEECFQRINLCPLGAVAGYGSSWPLNRKLTAKLLNFDDVLSNSIDCVTTRWEVEAELTSTISFLMNHLSNISQDIIFFSTSSNPALILPSEFTTGSSVMPQKRNPDFAESTKGRSALIHGYLLSLLSIGKGNVSGYNKDTQWTKYVVIDAINTAKDAPNIFRNVFLKLKPNKIRMNAQINEGHLNATDIADALVREMKIPFRTAYKIIKEATTLVEDKLDYQTFSTVLKKHAPNAKFDQKLFDIVSDPNQSIKLKKLDGGPAPSAIISLNKKLLKELSKIKAQNKINLNKISTQI